MTAGGREAAVIRYGLDKSASRFTVRVFAGGMLSALGHSPTIAIRDFSGEAGFDPDAPAQGSLRIEIRADSLEVADEMGSKDRREIEGTMKGSVLESAKHPTIVFEAAARSAEAVGEGRYKIAMNGNLSLRGVTRGLPVTAQVSVNGDTLQASGEFSLLQSDFGIPPIRVAGGALKVKDELKFTFDIAGRKKE